MLLVPTLHPGLLLKSGDEDGQTKFEQTVIGDLKKGLRLTHSEPAWDESLIFQRDSAGRLWRCFPNSYEVRWFFERFYAACARHPHAVQDGSLSMTLDVETTKDAPMLSQLICVGLGFRAPTDEQVLNVPILSCGGARYWSEQDEAHVRSMLAQVMADVRIPKTCHNKGFDTAVMWANGMAVRGHVWDTMAAHHVLDGELPHNLGYVGSILTDGRYWKDDSKGDGGFLGIPDEQLRTYNLRDILVTQRVKAQLHAQLKNLRLWDLYLEQLRGIDVMTRASMRGMLIDERRRTSRDLDEKGKFVGLQPQLEKQRDDAVASLRVISGSAAFDPAKPAHISELLFKTLNLPVVLTSPKTGKPKVDKEAMMLLEMLATTNEQRGALKGIIEFRQAEKFLGTFIHGLGKFVDPRTWRFHTQWKLLAVSGRWTSSPNCQNWNKKVKAMFHAPPGWKYVGVDLSQAELRFMAYLANDQALLTMYAQNINVHTVNTCLLFKVKCPNPKDMNPVTEAFVRSEMQRIHNLDYDKCQEPPASSWKTIRTLGKSYVFAANYGAEAETMHKNMRSKRDPDSNKLLFPTLLLSEIQALAHMWTKVLHPEIPQFWESVQLNTRKAGGYFCPISGRVRWFRGGFKRNEMLNIGLQMGVASWMNKCMVEIQDTYDRETGGAAQVVQQVHDALNVECPEEYADRAGKVMNDVLNREFPLLGHTATLPADAALTGDYLDQV